jgi:hypothetical protein
MAGKGTLADMLTRRAAAAYGQPMPPMTGPE